MILELKQNFKYNKNHLKKKKGIEKYKFNFGNWAIQSLITKYISINEFNNLYKDLIKFFKNNTILSISKFNILQFTYKNLESRMGGGKGNNNKIFLYFKKYTILFEIKSFKLNKDIINYINKISNKLSFDIQILKLYK